MHETSVGRANTFRRQLEGSVINERKNLRPDDELTTLVPRLTFSTDFVAWSCTVLLKDAWKAVWMNELAEERG